MQKGRSHKLISPFSVVLVMVALSIVGIASIPRLNIQYTPSTSSRSIQVYYELTDASAEIVEAEVTSLLEGALALIRGSTRISSVSQKGSGNITIEFRKGTNMDAARFEVASAIRNIYSSLPDGVTYPEIEVLSDSESRDLGFVLSYYLKGEMPSLEIDRFATKNILPALSAVKGVDGVYINGATPFHWVITFDAPKASVAGITADDIAEAIRAAFREDVIGMVQTGDGLLALRLSGEPHGDFGGIPVKNVGGRVLHLEDIARWEYVESEPSYYYRVNGLNTVILSVSVSGTDNMLSTVGAVKKEMNRLQESFPPGISGSLAYDASDYVNKELRKIFLRTGLCILILLVLVFLTSWSWRYLLVIASTLAVNILSALAIYSFVGLQIHIYTLAGITVSLGIIIDTSIVMVDHFGYWKDRKAFPAIFAATATTVAALLLVLLLPENARANLTDFIWVIAINLALSMFVAYFFIPSLMAYLPERESGMRLPDKRKRYLARLNSGYRDYIQWGADHRWLYVSILVVGFGIPTCLLPNPSAEKIASGGKLSLTERIASWKPYSENREIVDRLLGTSFRLFYNTLDRSSFYRTPVRPQLFIQAGMLEGATVGQLNEVVKSMENYLAGFDEIESFTTTVSAYDRGVISVRFKPEHERTAFPARLKEEVKAIATNFGGASWQVYGINKDNFSNRIVNYSKSYAIALNGYNYWELRNYAYHLRSYLASNKRIRDPEVWNARYNRPVTEFDLEYDFGSMLSAGVNPYYYYGILSSRLYDQSVCRVITDGYPAEVVLRSSEYDSYDLWHILHAPIQVDSVIVTLSEVGNITKKTTGVDIQKENQSYRVSVCFDYVGSFTLANKTIEDAIDYMNSSVLPVGFKAYDEYKSWQNVPKERYFWLILLIVAAIFAMLTISFESLRNALAVILMIPVSYIGVFLTFGLTNFSFDQGGFAAFVMLSGIVVNAGIYLVSTYKRFCGTDDTGQKAPSRQYIKAFNHKVIPISLTILSTVLGLLPFMTDGPDEVFWFDFAIGTIGGLLFSAIAIVLFLPVFLLKKRR